MGIGRARSYRRPQRRHLRAPAATGLESAAPTRLVPGRALRAFGGFSGSSASKWVDGAVTERIEAWTGDAAEAVTGAIGVKGTELPDWQHPARERIVLRRR